MGLFDTIVLDSGQFQTKAFGAWGNTFTFGDAVRVMYKSQTEREYALNRVHQYDDLPPAYTVEAGHGRDQINVLILGGKIACVVDTPSDVHFDRRGHSVGKIHYEPVFTQVAEQDPGNTRAEDAIAAILGRRRAPRPE
ncbi:Uncharacterised protein [Mycobacteroides abscessus subsp. abscessus]|jgi:hypothetical protein|uniref:hypothetical protein n=1 Tax=Mycobacteroides abscessus TaxID=36809 RepID=UPI00092A1EFF|nr:hypothetical protein [Mycobacteroides abscessus]SIH26438.1 Uncharacterised protein [Mycobacteroides abscessus subsp. abscessus]